MTFEMALRARLLAAGAITALAGDRVDWNEPAQGTASTVRYPRVILQVVAMPRPQHMQGPQGLREATVQANCSARTAGEKVALREAVIAVLMPAAPEDGVTFRRGFVEAVRDRSADAGPGLGYVHRDEIDFRFWFSEGD